MKPKWGRSPELRITQYASFASRKLIFILPNDEIPPPLFCKKLLFKSEPWSDFANRIYIDNRFGYWWWGHCGDDIAAPGTPGGSQRPQPLAWVNMAMLIGRICRERNCHWKRATCKHVPKPYRNASDLRNWRGKRHCCTRRQLTRCSCFFLICGRPKQIFLSLRGAFEVKGSGYEDNGEWMGKCTQSSSSWGIFMQEELADIFYKEFLLQY